MNDKPSKADVARQALALCVNRLEGRSAVATTAVLESIRGELEWLVAYFEGGSLDRHKLQALVFGHYAARQIDESDAEFIDALRAAHYEASTAAKELKKGDPTVNLLRHVAVWLVVAGALWGIVVAVA